MSYVRLGGKVNFTDDQKIVDRCFENSEVLTSQFGNNRSVVLAYYLTDVWAEFFAKEAADSGDLYLWEDEGVVVSMARIAHRTDVYGRINTVYTDLDKRGKGYVFF